MSAGNFFPIFFGGTCRDRFGEGWGDFTVVSQHLRVANALYICTGIFKFICVQLIYFALAADQQFLNRFCIFHTY